MSKLSVLFIGGTGTISMACVRRAIDQGMAVTLLNRGTNAAPEDAEVIRGDIRDPESVRSALRSRTFDVVIDFVAFTPEQVAVDIDLFRDRVGQFVFISSASAYQKPVGRLPIVESTPLRNPYWQYSQDKIACEDLLINTYRESGFPITIVRPSHTYDAAGIPLLGGHLDITRMREGKPVLVQGDGTSLWVLTHSTDFAKAFVGLLGHPQAIGDSFHITSDEALTWNQIYRTLGNIAGVEPQLVHVASETIARILPSMSGPLLGDKANSVIFDNAKVKALVPDFVCTTPYSVGARQQIDWYDANPGLHKINTELAGVYDELIAAAG